MGTFMRFSAIHLAQFKVDILCPTENIQSKFQFFLHASQHDCTDTSDPWLQFFNSSNLGSINFILNFTPQKDV
jgi:hypothetical protein